MPLHGVLGTDEGGVMEAATKLFRKYASNDGDFSNELIDGRADDSEGAYQICGQTVGALQTLGLFGAQKVVWLKGANFLGDDRTGNSERSKQGVEILLNTLQAGLPDEVIFILSCSQIDKRRAFYKWFSKNAQVEVHDRIDISKDGWEDAVSGLIRKHSQKLELEFEPEALELFVQLVGEDTRRIHIELEKISLYLGPNGKAAPEDVRLMVPLSSKGIIWDLSRALERGDAPRALSLLHKQMDLGEKAIGLLRAAVIPTIRNLLHARILLSEDRKVAASCRNYRSFQAALERITPELAMALPRKKDGGLNTWGLFQAAQNARNFSLKHLIKCLKSCLQADISLVTTQLEAEIVMERLIVEITNETNNKAKKG